MKQNVLAYKSKPTTELGRKLNRANERGIILHVTPAGGVSIDMEKMLKSAEVQSQMAKMATIKLD